MQDDIKPVLTDTRIVEIARSLRWQTQYAEIRANALELGRVIEREVLRVLADREGRQQWISVDERLPEPGIDVLVRCDYHGRDAFDVAGIFHGEWASHVTEHDCRHTVTHWQPLPDPPADAQRAKGDAA